jgi:iron complex transport system permease protein
MMFLVSVSRNNQIHSIIWWLLGSLEIIDSSQLLGIGITVIIGTLAGIFYSKELNILSLGDNSAVNLGVNAEFFKKIFFILASFLAASTVAVCGIVGFVGLIIPHIMRLIVGPDHRILIPASALSGAIFLTACDILARNIISPAELPIGVITALCGGPFFIFLLRKKRKMFF